MNALDPQVGFRFRLVHPNGQNETMLVDADRALVGSAAHCEVRLPPELCAHEHVEVVASQGAIHWATRPMAMAVALPTLDGVPLASGMWGPGSMLAVGPVRMWVELVPLGPPKAKPPLWALSVVLPLLAVTVATIALAHGPRSGDAPIPEAPALFPAEDTATCPSVQGDQRAAMGAEKLRVALSKRERSPFAPGEGVEAVITFDRASACFKLAGLGQEEASARADARALRQRMDDDFRVHRVRLEHAYRIHDPVAAKRELGVLLPMTSHLRGPYVDWLGSLDRYATAALDQRGRLAP